MTTTAATDHPRIFRFSETHNVRHLGGYATRSGQATSAQLVRSASLHRMTPEEFARLAEHGVRTVVDFRSGSERLRDVTPDLSPFGMSHLVAQVINLDASPATEVTFRGYFETYKHFLDAGAPAYRTFFSTVAASDAGVLFHCAGGKDRTGLAAALLLDLAGVDDATIAEDYHESNTWLAPVFEAFVAGMMSRGTSREEAVARLDSPTEVMLQTLAYVRERWGSSEGYLDSIGIGPAEAALLRAKLIAPG